MFSRTIGRPAVKSGAAALRPTGDRRCEACAVASESEPHCEERGLASAGVAAREIPQIADLQSYRFRQRVDDRELCLVEIEIGIDGGVVVRRDGRAVPQAADAEELADHQ